MGAILYLSRDRSQGGIFSSRRPHIKQWPALISRCAQPREMLAVLPVTALDGAGHDAAKALVNVGSDGVHLSSWWPHRGHRMPSMRARIVVKQRGHVHRTGARHDQVEAFTAASSADSRTVGRLSTPRVETQREASGCRMRRNASSQRPELLDDLHARHGAPVDV